MRGSGVATPLLLERAVERVQQQVTAQNVGLLACRLGNQFPPGTLLNGRYEVVELLGQGSNGVTYRCRDTAEGRDVAVNLKGGWNQLELFQQEAKVLAALEHPGIPHYLACFKQDTERDRAFFLVQEAVHGPSLAAMLRVGWRPDEAQVARIAIELLSTLWDVKPENIVVEGAHSRGKVYLVDFGSVQAATEAADDPFSGATVVGTFGFMAPEQLGGAASPASDLYGLGATLLLLLSGRLPSAFPADRQRLDISSVKIGAPLRAVLEGLLEPAPEERMLAEEALEGPLRLHSAAEAAIERRRPRGSRVVIKKRGPRLEIVIPPRGCEERVTIGRASWKIEQQLAVEVRGASKWREGGIRTHEASGRVADLREADTLGITLRCQMVLRDREQEDFGFGESLAKNNEAFWLKEVINEHLKELWARSQES
ncbi:hypothetical protein ABPG77_002810 [Micractinium sp. CCAP 211/92]